MNVSVTPNQSILENSNGHQLPLPFNDPNNKEQLKAELTNREKLLQEAIHITTGPRNTTYGDPKDNFADIAALWNTYTDASFKSTDVALMMILVKVARLMNKPNDKDGWLDIAGYAACGWDCEAPK